MNSPTRCSAADLVTSGVVGEDVDGGSRVLAAAFAEAGRHARAVGVAELPLGAPVEVEIVLSLGHRSR